MRLLRVVISVSCLKTLTLQIQLILPKFYHGDTATGLQQNVGPAQLIWCLSHTFREYSHEGIFSRMSVRCVIWTTTLGRYTVLALPVQCALEINPLLFLMFCLKL